MTVGVGPQAGRRRARRRSGGRRRDRPALVRRCRPTPPASRRRSRPGAGSAAGGCPRRRARCGRRSAPATPSPSTTHVQPKPFAMRTPSSGSWAAAQARATSMLARSARTVATHSAWPGPRTVAAHRSARFGEPRGVRRRSGVVAGPTRAAGRARTRGCCRAAGSGPSRPSTTSTVTERAVDQPATTSTADVSGTSSAARTCSVGLEGRSAGEARQCPQAPLVVGEQQVVAPGDRRGEGATPLGPPAGRIPQQGEAVVETSRDLAEPTAT